MPENPFVFAAQILERRWTLRVLYALEKKPSRFNEIMKSIPGISTQSLGRVLVALEETGVITRTVKHSRPVRITYMLSSVGSLSQILQGVAEWGAILLEKRIVQKTTDPPANTGNAFSKK